MYSKTDNTNSFFYDYMKSVNGNAKEPYDKDSLISAYNKHNNEVTEFFKDKPTSGEYILLTEQETINGIKIPKNRAWYYNKDDSYLGTDVLMTK